MLTLYTRFAALLLPLCIACGPLHADGLFTEQALAPAAECSSVLGGFASKIVIAGFAREASNQNGHTLRLDLEPDVLMHDNTLGLRRLLQALLQNDGVTIQVESLTASEQETFKLSGTMEHPFTSQDERYIREFLPEIETYFLSIMTMSAKISTLAQAGGRATQRMLDEITSWLTVYRIDRVIQKKLIQAERQEESSASQYKAVSHIAINIAQRVVSILSLFVEDPLSAAQTIEFLMGVHDESQRALTTFRRIAQGQRIDIGTTVRIRLPIVERGA